VFDKLIYWNNGQHCPASMSTLNDKPYKTSSFGITINTTLYKTKYFHKKYFILKHFLINKLPLHEHHIYHHVQILESANK